MSLKPSSSRFICALSFSLLDYRRWRVQSSPSSGAHRNAVHLPWCPFAAAICKTPFPLSVSRAFLTNSTTSTFSLLHSSSFSVSNSLLSPVLAKYKRSSISSSESVGAILFFGLRVCDAIPRWRGRVDLQT